MEAKDTVMSNEAEYPYWGRESQWKWNIHDLKEHLFNQCNHKWIEHNIDNLLKTQAEISFKARQPEIDSLLGQIADLKELKSQAEITERKAGMKEVVEWLNESDWGRRKGFDWQAKLKEWGL